MSAQVEDADTIQPWRQANQFTITCRGHWSGIPEPAQTIRLGDYNIDDIDNVAPQIREIASDGNYNTIYDSFYAPLDFQLSGIAIKISEFLPTTVRYNVSFKVNNSQYELFEVPQDDDHNQKQYKLDCTSVIYEDDFVEVAITINGPIDDLEFNAHNAVFSISGCAWYGMYKEVFAGTKATVATTEEILLEGLSNIDGFSVTEGDIVLVKNQSVVSENGLWEVATGAWTRSVLFPSIESLEDIIIFVENGDTQNSIDATNYILNPTDLIFEFPVMEWVEGDKWFKGQIHLQNRSGNETLTDRVIVDSVKATHNFLIQGISISVLEDPLMVVRTLKTKGYCFFIDVLVNGISILPALNFPRPISIDTNLNQFKEYDLEVFNDLEGYPVRFGDVVSLKLYQQNKYIRTNGKLIQCSLYGCGPDCAALESPLVAVYEPCDGDPCEFKFQINRRCDPEAAKEARRNPEVKTSSPSLPVERDYITVDGLYVTVNNKRVWL